MACLTTPGLIVLGHCWSRAGQSGKHVESRLVTEDDVVMIPSFHIHLEHKMVSPEFNRAKDLMPLLLESLIPALLTPGSRRQVCLKRHLSDLFLVDHTGGRIWGAKKEFVSRWSP